MSWKPGQSVRLSTPRFIIRSMTRADVTRDFLRWQNDPELCAGQNLPRKATNRINATQTVEKADNRRIFYLLICASIAELPIGFYAVRADPKHLFAETMVVIGNKDYWGKRVVLETRAVLIDFLFEQLGIQKITGRPHARNLASIFNYKAQGFTMEGVLRQQLTSVVDGSRLDQIEFGLLKDEWQAHKLKAAQ